MSKTSDLDNLSPDRLDPCCTKILMLELKFPFLFIRTVAPYRYRGG